MIKEKASDMLTKQFDKMTEETEEDEAQEEAFCNIAEAFTLVKDDKAQKSKPAQKIMENKLKNHLEDGTKVGVIVI
jgi:hypothetical protein